MSDPTDHERLPKKQRREEARAQRKALEEEERAGASHRKRLTQAAIALGVLAAVAVVAIVATGGGGGSAPVSGSGASAGLQTTRAPWPPQESALGTRLATLSLPLQNDGAYHVHAALQVYVDGRQVPVPAGIGAEVGPSGGSRLAALHTHDPNGVIHIESSEQYPFTLGQFFTIWGVKFTSTQLGAYLAGNGNVLSVYVNGKLVANPVGYVMKPHDNIVVGYGKPGSFPTSFQYNFPQGV